MASLMTREQLVFYKHFIAATIKLSRWVSRQGMMVRLENTIVELYHT